MWCLFIQWLGWSSDEISFGSRGQSYGLAAAHTATSAVADEFPVCFLSLAISNYSKHPEKKKQLELFKPSGDNLLSCMFLACWFLWKPLAPDNFRCSDTSRIHEAFERSCSLVCRLLVGTDSHSRHRPTDFTRFLSLDFQLYTLQQVF